MTTAAERTTEGPEGLLFLPEKQESLDELITRFFASDDPETTLNEILDSQPEKYHKRILSRLEAAIMLGRTSEGASRTDLLNLTDEEFDEYVEKTDNLRLALGAAVTRLLASPETI